MMDTKKDKLYAVCVLTDEDIRKKLRQKYDKFKTSNNFDGKYYGFERTTSSDKEIVNFVNFNELLWVDFFMVNFTFLYFYLYRFQEILIH